MEGKKPGSFVLRTFVTTVHLTHVSCSIPSTPNSYFIPTSTVRRSHWFFNSAKSGEELPSLGRKTRARERACRGDVADALLVRRSAGRGASNPDGGVREAGKRRR